MEKMSKEQFCAVYGGGSEDCFPHRQEQDRQAAVEALAAIEQRLGVDHQWKDAEYIIAHLEAHGFTIVRKEKVRP